MLGTSETLLTHDNLDDRREIWRLLSHIPPADRFQAVAAIGRWAKGIDGRQPPVLYLDGRDREAVQAARVGDRDADRRITQMCWGFLMLLCNTWNVDAVRVTLTLEALGKGRIRVRNIG